MRVSLWMREIIEVVVCGLDHEPILQLRKRGISRKEV